MTIYFAGGEDIDFTYAAAEPGIDTENGFRPSHARLALYAQPGLGIALDNGIETAFPEALSALWAGFRFSYQGEHGDAGSRPLVAFHDDLARLGIDLNDSGTLSVSSLNDEGVRSVLATSSATLPIGVLSKLDVQIAYAAAGRVYVYLDGVLILTATGDVRAAGSTSLARMSLHSPSSGTSYLAVSEVLVADKDTRTLALKTLVPSAIADAASWTGAIADITEVRADGVAALETVNGDANAVLMANTVIANASIAALKVQARAARGETGPLSLALGAGTSTGHGFAADQAVGTDWVTLSATFARNPATNAAWNLSQIADLRILLGSRGQQATRIVFEEGGRIMTEDGSGFFVAERR